MTGIKIIYYWSNNLILEPIVTCEGSSFDVSFDEHYFTPSTLEKMHLEDEDCGAVSNGTHFNIRVKNAASSCLMQVNFNSSHVIFSNILHYVITQRSDQYGASDVGAKKMAGNMTLKCSRKRRPSDHSLMKYYRKQEELLSDALAAFYLPKSKSWTLELCV